MLRRALMAWLDDYAPSMGAALAYYTLFSIAPLLVIAIAVASLVFGEEVARGELVAQMQSLIGSEGAFAVQSLLRRAQEPSKDIVALGLSLIVLMLGAASLSGELQSDLDRIWRTPETSAPASLSAQIWSRLRAMVLVIGLGTVLLLTLLSSAAIAALGFWQQGWLSGWQMRGQWINSATAFTIATLIFAMLYKFLPRAHIAWRDVWVGALVTSLLFEAGKLLIAFYLASSGVASGLGAAGSMLALLLWVYFSAQIFLFGAELTWVYAHERGSQVLPR